MGESSRSYLGSSVVPFRLVFLMWLVFTFQMYTHIDLTSFGILPRSLWGLIGIFTAPMLHGNLMHLISNTVPLLFLGGTLFFFYNRIGVAVFFRCYFITNILVWLFRSSQSSHWRKRADLWTLRLFDFLWLFAQRHDVLSHLHRGDPAVRRDLLWNPANRPMDLLGITPGGHTYWRRDSYCDA